MTDEEASRQAQQAAQAETDAAAKTGREADAAAKTGRKAEDGRGRSDGPRTDAGEGETSFGPLGRPIRRDSPFMLGFLGALGVFVAYFLVTAVVQARSVIILIVVSLFLAVGLNPVVESLVRRGLRRGFAIGVVFLVVVGVFVAFGFAVVPPVVDQTNSFVKDLPNYLADLRKNPTIRQFDEDYGVIQRAQDYVTSGGLGQRVFGGLVGVGRIVLNAVFGAFSVLIMTLYFLASLPSMKRQAYRLVPATRRERVQLLTDVILDRIGGFVSGAFTVAFIATVSSYILLNIISMPFALALAVLVGLLDLVPLVGATLGATVVTVLAFIESPAKGIVCVLFFLAYQQFENYVIYPHVMRRAVDVPAALTVVAVLIGGALLGVVGALLAIPIAAAALLVAREVFIPRMDRV